MSDTATVADRRNRRPQANDADTAIKVAIKAFEITDKHEQSRIAVVPDR